MFARMTIVALALGLSSTVPGQSPGQPAKPTDQKPLPILQAAPLKPEANDDELRKVMIERYNEIAKVVKNTQMIIDSGSFNPGILSHYHQACGQLVDSKLALTENSAERIDLLAQLVELSKRFELEMQRRFEIQAVSIIDLHQAKYHRLDAQVRLLQAKNDAEKKSK